MLFYLTVPILVTYLCLTNEETLVSKYCKDNLNYKTMADFNFSFWETETHSEQVYAYTYNDEPEIGDNDTLYLAEAEVTAEYHHRRRGVNSWDVRFLTVLRDGVRVDESTMPSDVRRALWVRAIDSYNWVEANENAAQMWRQYEAEQSAIADLQKADVI